MQKKYKALFIGNNDNRLYGHAYFGYSSFSDVLFEKKLVVVYPTTNDIQFSIKTKVQDFSVISRIKRHVLRAFKSLFVYGQFPIIKYSAEGNRFYDLEAEQLPFDLFKKKIGSFHPDVILFYWTDGLVASTVIKKLADYYSCKIALVFVDQQYIAGGCHFPTDCENHKNGCVSCPSLLFGKKLASIQYASRKCNFSGLKKIIIAPPADLQMAKDSELLGDSLHFIDWVLNPDVKFYSQMESRAFFKIPDNSFVIMIGAASLKDKRKGIEYSIDAINRISEELENVTLLCTGNLGIEVVINKKINIVNTGWLSRNDLFKAYCASDCFISSSIADSGPIMLNYAVALGVPVISFNIGTAVALVEHKKTGYIAKYRDTADIAKGISFIYHLSNNEKIEFRNRAIELIKEKSSMKVDEELYRVLQDNESIG